MFRERSCVRRCWIVGSVVLSVAVVIMIFTPPPRMLMYMFNKNFFEVRKSREGLFESQLLSNTSALNSEPPTEHASNMYTYVEEPPAGVSLDDEIKRFMTTLSTQGAVCSDVRRIGGSLFRRRNGAPRPYGPDGMWYVCFDEEVQLNPASCIVYSFGINNDFSFDDKMGKHGCNVFSFDPTMGKDDHNHSARVKFFNLGLSDVNQELNRSASSRRDKSGWKTRTLATIIQELGHSEREIDVLKMDIESDEWKCLRQMLADGTLKRYARQLDVEFHLRMRKVKVLRHYYSTAKWLERQGFRIFHTRRNAYCSVCWEMSYVNTNLVKLPLN